MDSVLVNLKFQPHVSKTTSSVCAQPTSESKDKILEGREQVVLHCKTFQQHVVDLTVVVKLTQNDCVHSVLRCARRAHVKFSLLFNVQHVLHLAVLIVLLVNSEIEVV